MNEITNLRKPQVPGLPAELCVDLKENLGSDEGDILVSHEPGQDALRRHFHPVVSELLDGSVNVNPLCTHHDEAKLVLVLKNGGKDQINFHQFSRFREVMGEQN